MLAGMAPTRLSMFAGFAAQLAGCSLQQEGLATAITRDDSTATPEPQSPPVQDASWDAGARPRGDAEPVAPPMVDPGCPVAGTRALRIDAQVSWKGSALLDIVPVVWAGDGQVQITALVDMTGSANAGEASIRACRASVPPFLSSLQEVYAVQFADKLWDAVDTRWKTSVTRGCADPGCSFTADYVEAQLGVELPRKFSWPGPRQPLASGYLRDDDGDGVVGIPVTFAQQGNAGFGVRYANPPSGIVLSERTREINLGLRVAVSLAGKLDSCTRYSGGTTLMTIDTRALGCVLESGTLCDPEQVSFTNDNLPVWEVRSASWQLVDLPAGAGCTEARAAL